MGPEATFVTQGKCHFGKKQLGTKVAGAKICGFSRNQVFAATKKKKLIHLSRLLSLWSELEAKRGAERKRSVH